MYILQFWKKWPCSVIWCFLVSPCQSSFLVFIDVMRKCNYLLYVPVTLQAWLIKNCSLPKKVATTSILAFIFPERFEVGYFWALWLFFLVIILCMRLMVVNILIIAVCAFGPQMGNICLQGHYLMTEHADQGQPGYVKFRQVIIEGHPKMIQQ